MKKDLGGMISLEAALVMPVILYTIIAIVYFLIFLYDRNAMEEAASLAVMQTFYSGNVTNEETEKVITQKCRESLKDRLVAVENLQLQVNVGKNSAQVILTGNVKMADLSGWGGMFPFGDIKVDVTSSRLCSGQFVREVRKGEKLTEWLKKKKDE